MDRDEFLKLLRCPVSRAPVVVVGDWLYSTDPITRRKYVIRGGIPVMLAEEGVQVSEEEFQRVMAQANQASPGTE